MTSASALKLKVGSRVWVRHEDKWGTVKEVVGTKLSRFVNVFVILDGETQEIDTAPGQLESEAPSHG